MNSITDHAVAATANRARIETQSLVHVHVLAVDQIVARAVAVDHIHRTTAAHLNVREHRRHRKLQDRREADRDRAAIVDQILTKTLQLLLNIKFYFTQIYSDYVTCMIRGEFFAN